MPTTRRRIVGHAGRYGIALEEGGNHSKLMRDGICYPIPRGSGGLEIPDCYLRGYCRAFGFDLAKVKEEL